MSLTRAQWLEMFKHAKKIENLVMGNANLPLIDRQRILNNVELIKQKIQSVVGQLE